MLIHVVCNSFIDEGRNPDEYTRNLLNSCVQRNQVSRGKVDAFKVRYLDKLSVLLFWGPWNEKILIKECRLQKVGSH